MTAARAGTSSAVCTKLSATKSTPSSRPNRRSAASFSVTADAGSGTPGALMPLCSPSGPPSTTSSTARRRRCARRRAARSCRRPAAADRRAAPSGSSSAIGREDPPGPPTSSPARDPQLVSARAARAACRRGSGPVRIFGPLRSCMIATWRPAARGRLANRAESGARAIRACRARNSAGTRRRRRRAAPRASPGAADAGPTVATILVWRMSRSCRRPRIDERLGDPHRLGVGQRLVQAMRADTCARRSRATGHRGVCARGTSARGESGAGSLPQQPADLEVLAVDLVMRVDRARRRRRCSARR